MAYTKDYYSILGLAAPNPNSNSQSTSTADLRRAYKFALLAAHPDKNTGANTSARSYTVDEVKEAYTVLANANHKAEYDNWLLRHPNAVQSHGEQIHIQAPSSDFVLGLELLDLSDFDVLDPDHMFSQDVENGTGGVEEDDGAQMEWTRACRCGDVKGFRILEEELGDAETRGEKEVLVGCGGCSLWVRVGFEVEVG